METLEFTVRCSYMYKTQITRGIPRRELRRKDLFDICSQYTPRPQSGGKLFNLHGGEEGLGPDPALWMHAADGDVCESVGPWHRLGKGPAAFAQCEKLLGGPESGMDPMTPLMDTESGLPDWKAIFDREGTNQDLLRDLDRVRWCVHPTTPHRRLYVPISTPLAIEETKECVIAEFEFAPSMIAWLAWSPLRGNGMEAGTLLYTGLNFDAPGRAGELLYCDTPGEALHLLTTYYPGYTVEDLVEMATGTTSNPGNSHRAKRFLKIAIEDERLVEWNDVRPNEELAA